VALAVLAEQHADHALAHGDRDQQDLGWRVPTISCSVDGRSSRRLADGIATGRGVIANTPSSPASPGAGWRVTKNPARWWVSARYEIIRSTIWSRVWVCSRWRITSIARAVASSSARARARPLESPACDRLGGVTISGDESTFGIGIVAELSSSSSLPGMAPSSGGGIVVPGGPQPSSTAVWSIRRRSSCPEPSSSARSGIASSSSAAVISEVCGPGDVSSSSSSTSTARGIALIRRAAGAGGAAMRCGLVSASLTGEGGAAS
jgi:hypothetical protein